MKKLISMALCLIMVLTLFVGFMTVGASAEGDVVDPGDSENIVLEKSAVLKDNGKYDITLRSFATGLTTSVTTPAEGTPLDIVCVVDQSGSMGEEISGVRRVEILQAAMRSFVSMVNENAKNYNVNHRIAIVGFAGDNNSVGTSATKPKRNCDGPDVKKDYWKNTGIFIGGQLYKYGSTKLNSNTSLTADNYKAALVSSDSNDLQLAINNFGYNSFTHTEYGLKMAKRVFENTLDSFPSNGKRIVILFTDGDTDSNENNLVSEAYDIKNIYGADIFCVSFSNDVSDNTCLQRISSNYPYATSNSDSQFTYSEVYGTAEELFAVNAYKTQYYVKHDPATLTALYGDDAGNHTDGFMRFGSLHFCDNDSSGKAGATTHNYISDYNYGGEHKNPYGAGFFETDTHLGNIIGISIPMHVTSSSDAAKQIRFPKTDKDNTTVTIHTGENTTAEKPTVQFYVRRDIDTSKYFMSAANSNGLDAAFKAIAEEITSNVYSTDVTLNVSAYIKDALGESFMKNLTNDQISTTVYKVESYDGTNKTCTNGAVDADLTNIVEATINGAKDEIEVTHFSYVDAYVAPGRAESRVLEIKISDVDLDFSKTPVGLVDTNASGSGIYNSTDVFIEAFEKPKTYIADKTIVVDYADKYEITPAALGLNSISKTAGDLNYGAVSTNNGKYYYTPNTMQWNGVDSVYAFGKKNTNEIPAEAAETNNGNLWTKVSVIPANNIYYEDSFVATNGITYNGNWTTVTGAANTQVSVSEDAKAVHGGGWEYVNTEYSGGSANSTSEAGATAQFTFTGTGVDVYTYTTKKSGSVLAYLYQGDSATGKAMKMLLISNKSESNDSGYYQIPTVYFKDLDYGTYTVKILAKGNGAYSIDGIRIYNPLSDDTVENNPVVAEAYTNEDHAKFISVREKLLKNPTGDEFSGAVFIDKVGTDDSAQTAVASKVITDYDNYGPKNEVYLANGQAIVFRPESGTNFYIGLKAPNGETTASVSNGSEKMPYTIKGATEQYYKVAPNDEGMIMIENAGNGMLSVTNLRVTGAPVHNVSFMAMPRMMVMSYANSFDTLDSVEPEETDVIDSEDINTPEDVDTTEETTTPDTPEDSGNDNHSPATVVNQIIKMVKNLFGGLKKLFKDI